MILSKLNFIRKLNTTNINGLLLACSFSTKYRVNEIKNSSMLIIQDKLKSFPYMAEIQTDNGNKGVVMKIQDNKTYIGMYEELKQTKQIQITKISKTWKQGFNPLLQNILKHGKYSGIYDVNGQKLQSKAQIQLQALQQLEIKNGDKRRIGSASPILNVCNDLYYGDMMTFIGCRGSKKSQNAWKIVQEFENNKALCIYVNPYFREAKQLLNKTHNTVALSVLHNKKPTDVGVYMMTLKAMNLSNQLKKKGFDVLLVVDNFNDIMFRQWNLLQTIKFNSKSADSSKLFQYNNLKIPPISIINEIYSNCQDLKRSNSKKQGSLTSIIISQKQTTQLMQQISSYGNNLKHLQTLSSVIKFPLQLKLNNNLYYQKDIFSQVQQANINQINSFMRQQITSYINQKQQTQLKRQLYKNELKDAPWDYFVMLDAQWWTKALLDTNFTNFNHANTFLQWVKYNIQNDILGQWNITAKQSYQKFQNYLAANSIKNNNQLFKNQHMQAFIQDSKMEGLLNPFKKDYLN